MESYLKRSSAIDRKREVLLILSSMDCLTTANSSSSKMFPGLESGDQ